MAEGEAAQERAYGRGGEHPVAHHRSGVTAAQHVGVVDVVSAGDHGIDQGEGLCSRRAGAHPAHQADRGVDQRF